MNKIPVLILLLLPVSAQAITAKELYDQYSSEQIESYVRSSVMTQMKQCKDKKNSRLIAAWYLREGGDKKIYAEMEKDFTKAVQLKEQKQDFFKAFRDLEIDILPSLLPVNCRL